MFSTYYKEWCPIFIVCGWGLKVVKSSVSPLHGDWKNIQLVGKKIRLERSLFRIRYFFNTSGSDPKTKMDPDPDPGCKGKRLFFFHVMDDSKKRSKRFYSNHLKNEKENIKKKCLFPLPMDALPLVF